MVYLNFALEGSVDDDNNPCIVIGLEHNPHPVIVWKGIKQGKVKQEVRAFKSEGIAPGLSTWCPHREDDKLAKTTLCNLSSLPEVFSCGPLVFCPYGIVHVQCCLVLVCASPVYGLPGTMFNWRHLDMGHASTGKRKSGSRRGSPMSHTSYVSFIWMQLPLYTVTLNMSADGNCHVHLVIVPGGLLSPIFWAKKG